MHAISKKLRLFTVTLTAFAISPILALAVETTNWIAFNDHLPGGGTAPNATRYNLRGIAGTPPQPTQGPLTNYLTGEQLDAVVSATATGSPDFFGTSGYPNPGTPAYNLFNGIVDVGNQDSMIGIRASAGTTTTLTFTNLDPGRRYVFRGTSVRGGNYGRRWTVCTLLGADSFVDTHTAGVYTMANFPSGTLTNGQAAYNSGENRAGELVGWDDIRPGADGSFAILSAQYTDNPLPNGQTPDLGTYGYAINAFMLAEVGPATPIEIVEEPPAETRVVQLRPFSLSVTVQGSLPRFQWYKEGIGAIAGATARTYSVASATLDHAGNYYVVVTNVLNAVTSQLAHVTVIEDTNPPTVLRVVGSATLNQVTVEFSEPMDPITTGDSFNYQIIEGLGITGVTLTNNDRAAVLTTALQAENTLYTLQVRDVADQVTNRIVTTNIQFRSWMTTPCAGLIFEAFNTGGGTAISLLTNHPSFPNNPVFSATLTRFDTREVYPDDTHDNYGARLRGVFIPPLSGPWVFYLRSDDASELYLNPNGLDPAGKVLIAYELGCCGNFEPQGAPETSTPQLLTAGQGYYIEALYKEGGGGDWLKVAARLADQPTPPSADNTGLDPEAIPGGMLGYPAAPSGIGGTLTIAPPPASLTVTQNTLATFTVGVSSTFGLPVCYQWRSNGVDIAGATGPSFSYRPGIEDHGTVFSVAVSLIGGATAVSAGTTLLVERDILGPVIVAVTADASLTNVLVTYNEPMDSRTAGDNFNYEIDGVPVQGAAMLSPTTVSLTPASPLQSCFAHALLVRDVLDLFTNSVSPNPTTVSFTPGIVLLAIDDVQQWKYHDTGADLGTAWREPGFDDNAWPSGAAILAFETCNCLPEPLRTPLRDMRTNPVPGSAYYFRTRINVPTDPATIARLQARVIVDDGLVVYINGAEAFRLGMAAGPVAFNTFASRTVGDGVYEGPFDLPTTNLVYGTNVIAVEVHQVNATSSDSTMALELIATVTECRAPRPPLIIERLGDGSVRLSWMAAGLKLVAANDPAGPYTDVLDGGGQPITASPHVIPPEQLAAKKFYGLQLAP